MTLAYTELGTGEPLVLVNGYGGAKGDWDPTFLDGLGQGSRVIAPDNRGIGDSPGLDGELTVASMAADTIALMDELGLDRVALAGWSMGGFIAQKLVTWIPDRIKSLTLLSTDSGGTRAHLRSPEAEAALTDKSGTPEEQADRLIDLLFPAGFAAQVKATAGEIVAASRARLDPEVLAEQEAAMAGWYGPSVPPIDQVSELAQKGLPVLIAHGLDDQVIPARNSRVLSGALEDAWLARFPGGGHAFMAQEPDRLSGLMSLFLAR